MPMPNAQLDLVSVPSRVAAAVTADSAPIQFSTAAALPAATHGTVYNTSGLQFGATGGSGTGYVYTAISKVPLGLTLSSSGLLSGTPLAAENAVLVVQVTDSVGNAVSRSFTLAIA